jgi:hypothetical protein
VGDRRRVVGAILVLAIRLPHCSLLINAMVASGCLVGRGSHQARLALDGSVGERIVSSD